MNRFHCLIVFTSGYIAQYVYCKSRCCDVRKFENNIISLIKPFFYITKTSKQTFKYLENEKCI